MGIKFLAQGKEGEVSRRMLYQPVFGFLNHILKYVCCIILILLFGYVNRSCLPSVFYKHQYAEHLCNISHINVLDANLRLPSDLSIDKAERNTLLHILQRYVMEMQWKCCHTEQFKFHKDRDVVICLDEINRTGMTCTVFIFGYKPGFEFEQAFWDGYYCLFRVFDSRVNWTKIYKPYHIAYHNWGLSDIVVKKYHPRNLSDICRRVDHINKTIDMLKLNAGGFDWKMLLNTVEKDELKLVKQLLLEIEIENRVDNNMKTKIAVLRNLFERGFRIFAVDINTSSVDHYSTITVSMINMNCYGIF